MYSLIIPPSLSSLSVYERPKSMQLGSKSYKIWQIVHLQTEYGFSIQKKRDDWWIILVFTLSRIAKLALRFPSTITHSWKDLWSDFFRYFWYNILDSSAFKNIL